MFESSKWIFQSPRLLFAGEATHAKEYSTTRGAFETGQEAAAVIARCLDAWREADTKNESRSSCKL
jgi:hypothetical protein